MLNYKAIHIPMQCSVLR